MSSVSQGRWQAGDVVVLRDVWRGAVWTAKPVTVVQDTPDLVALYLAPGTRWKEPRRADGSFPRMALGAWRLADVVWRAETLYLSEPGTAYAAILFWTPEPRRFRGWYINLQEPLRRTSIGFDTMDQTLDVLVWPDRSRWRWKDEEELEEARRLGLFSDEACRAFRAEGERASARAMAGEGPFSGAWRDWQPDPSWPVPALVAGWDVRSEEA